MLNVTLYTRAGCHLCEQAEADLTSLQETHPHKLTRVDIDSDTTLKDAFSLEIPVVEAGPFRLKAPFTRTQLQVTLGAAADRQAQLEKINDKAYQDSVRRGKVVSRGDRLSYWISCHYLLVLNLVLLLYVGLPFLGPVFKQVGWNGPAEVIYRVYRPLCHQWAFRSWFLFGEQAYYPHAEANIPGVATFEETSGISDQTDPSRTQARVFEGNPDMGFKVALCERDVAIWGAILLFGLVYAISGRRIPKLHWLLWIILGMIPVGLDGFSQVFSQIPLPFINAVLPYRESTPLLRSITGFLFGWTTAWFTIPLIEETMLDTRRLLAKKFAVVKS